MFSKSLDQEYAKDGISVQNQAPAFVATKMSKIRKANISTPTPATWVAAAIKHIGYEATSCPFWCAENASHSLLHCPSRCAYMRM